jgi:hypothetical protein
MSLSRPVTQNPAVRFYDWSGSRGELSHWDKEKQERIPVKLPFKFIVLDELHTVTGYSDADQSGYWSNEVRRTTDDLTVRTKRGVKYVGPYKDGRGIRQVPADSKYAKSVYITQKLDGEWVLANLKLSGAALTAWIDLSGKHRTEGNIIALVGSTEGSKGATKFQIPTIEFGGAPDGDTLQVATDLDATLQSYLDIYLTAPKYDDNAEPLSTDEAMDKAFEELGKATPEQQADFERRKAEKIADRDEDRAIKKQFEDTQSINLDDIPF